MTVCFLVEMQRLAHHHPNKKEILMEVSSIYIKYFYNKPVIAEKN